MGYLNRVPHSFLNLFVTCASFLCNIYDLSSGDSLEDEVEDYHRTVHTVLCVLCTADVLSRKHTHTNSSYK